MRNKLAALIAAVMICSAVLPACGDASSQTDESKTTENSSVSDSSSSLDSSSAAESSSQSENSSESSSESSLESKTDSSSQTETTTTTQSTTTTSAQETTTTTSTKAATTTTTTRATQSTVKPVVTTTTVRATQSTAKPVVTTKATTKAIIKETTRVTTKATTKQTADPTANMSPYYKALYRIGSGKGTTSDYETVRTEIINYGKKLYPAYKLNPNLHLYRLPNGKLTDDYQAGVTFTDVTCRDTLCLPSTSKEDIEYFDRMYKNLVIQNLNHLKAYNPKEWELSWYVQFSKQQIGTCVIVIAYIGDYIG